MPVPAHALLAVVTGVVPLTVHLVPHTHIDCGWLKTQDATYTGIKDRVSVRRILDTVTSALAKNPSRRFTWVEQSFFQRWFNEQDEAGRAATKKLVASGQLQFSNGGWCMHDEASTHFIDMIDQTTLGHRMIIDAFGQEAVPTTGWQLDPFGHSATNAALLSAEVGMDALFFGRIDHQDQEIRRANRSAEFIWRASPSLGPDAQVFAGLTGVYRGNYAPPDEFQWIIKMGSGRPVPDDPFQDPVTGQMLMELFHRVASQQGAETQGRNVMWTMGDDMTYEDAEPVFLMIDRLIRAVTESADFWPHDKIIARYSTPQEYVAAKQAEQMAAPNTSWPLKNASDFFPYADSPHKVWTGYFASRPALKGYIRTSSAIFGVARMLHAFASASAALNFPRDSNPLRLLEEALALSTHHDAITGTSRQDVAFDYAKRLAAGITQADRVISSSINVILNEDLQWRRCSRLNETVCEITQKLLQPGSSVRIAVVNSLAQARQEILSFPVTSTSITVASAAGGFLPTQIYEAGESVNNYARDTQEAALVASFVADLPPYGIATFELSTHDPLRLREHAMNPQRLRRLMQKVRSTTLMPVPRPKEESSVRHELKTQFVLPSAEKNNVVTLSNEHLELNFSRATGLLTSVVNKAAGLQLDVEQVFCYYDSAFGSGAYVFRPEGTTCQPVNESGSAIITAVVQGGVVQEVRQKFSEWLTQTVRLGVGWRHAEFEHTVGPLPLKGIFPIGKEMVSRFVTPIKSGGEMLTDSNGREMMRRQRTDCDSAEPAAYRCSPETVAYNFYPVATAAAIRDAQAQLTLLVDRGAGAASLSDGQIEIMVHRRLTEDDNCGLAQALDERKTIDVQGVRSGPGLVIRGSIHLSLEPPKNAAKVWRPLADRVYARPLVTFAHATRLNADGVQSLGETAPLSDVSGLRAALPDHLQIITLQELRPGRLLLRLAHQLGIDEDAQLTQVRPPISKIHGTCRTPAEVCRPLLPRWISRGCSTVSCSPSQLLTGRA